MSEIMVKPQKTYFDFKGKKCLDFGVCPICHEELNPQDRYCSGCGRKLDWSENDG